MTTSATKTIELKDISKKYQFRDRQDLSALKAVSLDVYQGRVLGVIGRNGSGKTTLLNIIAGTLSPTEGECYVKGRAVGLFNLGIGFQDALTGKENIFLNAALLGAGKKELEDGLGSIIEFSELGKFIEMPLGTYSLGMRLRLAFSVIANLDFDVLAIDEVMAVGDIPFQNKCYERLMDFKRKGKTLVITTQSMDLIERLCDSAALLDHGKLLFHGDVIEAVNKYRMLLNREKFFVGPPQENAGFIKDTKKWVDDVSGWGKRLGTKEVAIESVGLLNRFGRRCSAIKSRGPLNIKVHFAARDDVKDVHFGVAIFRKDGVYCYGPNTAFDRYEIPELKKGKGFFALNYRSVLLAPGEYKLAIAIWDKNETLAFDYHNGCYDLTVRGENGCNELSNIPFRAGFFKRVRRASLDLRLLDSAWGMKKESDGIDVEGVKVTDSQGRGKEHLVTNEPARIIVNFSNLNIIGNSFLNADSRRSNADGRRFYLRESALDMHISALKKFFNLTDKNPYLWIGIYRDDGIYCQGIVTPLGRRKDIRILFPKLALLPGGYRISLAVWGNPGHKLLMCHHGIYPFRMVFNRKDHGTVYLAHKWRLWK